ncbi:MAG: hypothetical protein VW600_13535 [Ferrovibrio sp.]
MATYYFVIAEDDMWWVKVRGRAYGGFLMRSHAVKQALHSARKCRGQAHVVVQEPQFRWRIEWSNQPGPIVADMDERSSFAAG